MDFIVNKKLNKAPIDGQFTITLYSYLLLFSLLIVWPLYIIIFFTPALSNLYQVVTDITIRFYLPAIIFQILVFSALVTTVKNEKSHILSVGFGIFKYSYLAYSLIFVAVLIILSKLIPRLAELIGIMDSALPDSLTPQSRSEIAVWIVMSAVVAVVEEAAFRGYLITRLARLFRSKYAAVFLASLAFSAGHFYQGYGGVFLIFIFGVLLADLFLYTRSIWPGILAHFLYNVTAPFI